MTAVSEQPSVVGKPRFQHNPEDDLGLAFRFPTVHMAWEVEQGLEDRSFLMKLMVYCCEVVDEVAFSLDESSPLALENILRKLAHVSTEWADSLVSEAHGGDLAVTTAGDHQPSTHNNDNPKGCSETTA